MKLVSTTPSLNLTHEKTSTDPLSQLTTHTDNPGVRLQGPEVQQLTTIKPSYLQLPAKSCTPQLQPSTSILLG